MKFKLITSVMILSILLVTCSNSSTLQNKTTIDNEIVTSERIITGEITFYVSNNDITGWRTYNKEINGGVVDIIEELKSNGQSFIPKETKVLSIEVKDGIANINLSGEFDTPQSNASTPASYKIKSIVKTLCLNKKLNIQGVKFLINGEYVKSIGPISTDEIIKE